MKKITLFCFLSAFSLFISCEEDDEVTFENKNYILGKWTLDQIGNINNANFINYQDYVSAADCESNNLVLAENNTYEQNYYDFVDNLCQNDQTSGNFELVNNNIILTYVDDFNETKQLTLTIISLTYTDLEISFTDEETEQLVFHKLKKDE
jgi:hypothetical protein